MKKTITLIIVLLVILPKLHSQTLEAYNLSKRDLTGTARSMSIGGATGALENETTNPAGINTIQQTEVRASFQLKNSSTETNMLDIKTKESKTSLQSDNLTFVTCIPTRINLIPKISIGLSYNKQKSFDRKYRMRGTATNSLTEYMVNKANDLGYNSNDLNLSKNEWNSTDWLSLLSYNSYLINEDAVNFVPSITLPSNQELSVREKGFVNNYTINLGTTMLNKLHFGLALTMTDIKYQLNTMHSEDFLGTTSLETGYFSLSNYLKTKGHGWQTSLGVIYQPIKDLNIGVVYHSPTWSKLTDNYSASIIHDLLPLAGSDHQEINFTEYNSGIIDSPSAKYKYNLKQPDRWVFSLSAVIDYVQLSIDYETTNNKRVSHDLKRTSSIRIGAEIKPTSQLSCRLGYAWIQTPIKDLPTSTYNLNSNPKIILEGNTNYFTWGVGYEFTDHIYSDIAFVIKTQKSDLFFFEAADKGKLKEQNISSILSVGYRF